MHTTPTQSIVPDAVGVVGPPCVGADDPPVIDYAVTRAARRDSLVPRRPPPARRRLVRPALVLAGLVLVATAFMTNGARSAPTGAPPPTTTPSMTTDARAGWVATGCAAEVRTAAGALGVDPVVYGMSVAETGGANQSVADVVMDTLQAEWRRLARRLDDEIRFSTQPRLDVGLGRVIEASRLELGACT